MALLLTATEVVAMLDSESEGEFEGYIEENCDNNESDAEMEWDGNECTIIDENECNASSSESSSSHTLDSSDQCTSRSSYSSSFQSSGITSFFPGCTFDMSGKSPVDFVQLFLTCTILKNIVTETNRYADDDYIQSHNLPPNSRVHKWKPCNLDDIKIFRAIIIGMTVDGKTRIEDYWSTWPFATNVFSSIMSRNRFQLLLRFFHLSDS